jgi:hypothetical protein
MLTHFTEIGLSQQRVVRRREFLKTIAAAGVAGGTLGWRDLMAVEANQLRRQGKACILLWMQGGPSHFETFSPKPEHANGGGTKAIATSVSGIAISHHLPLLAAKMHDLAIVRSMTSKEGAHPRATYLMHTGYLPTASVKYPTLGSFVAERLGDAALELPSFVRIGNQRQGGSNGSGVLGVDFEPFVMPSADVSPRHTTPTTDTARYTRRLNLLDALEAASQAGSSDPEVADHQKLYRKAAKMILSPRMSAFDLHQEPQSIRDAYGQGTFAAGCLMARRLIESGVTFVEVELNGWDTHSDNFNQSKQLCGQVDRPFAALIEDLKQRGMYENTLVVWMGEFGRTPRINPRGGRDHYPKAYNVVLGGCGIQGGQVIGKTDAGGAEVTDRPVTVPDLFQTFCKALSIDPNHENFAGNGRPLKIVDKGAPVNELFA